MPNGSSGKKPDTGGLVVASIFGGGLRQNTPHVPVDFTKDDLLTELVKGGYVTVYLPEAAVKGLEVVTDQQTTQMALCIARVPAHR